MCTHCNCQLVFCLKSLSNGGDNPTGRGSSPGYGFPRLYRQVVVTAERNIVPRDEGDVQGDKRFPPGESITTTKPNFDDIFRDAYRIAAAPVDLEAHLMLFLRHIQSQGSSRLDSTRLHPIHDYHVGS